MLTLEEIKERIVMDYDPDLVVEVLEISTEQLLDAFEDTLLRNLYKFGFDEDI